jgi:DNA polymerase elongation subunit (family B)
MIIHKEQVDYLLPDGSQTKKLIISYVDKECNVKFLQYPIPKEQMFEWKYTSKAYADPPFPVYDFEKQQYLTDDNGNIIYKQWKSYDNKFVRKKEVDKLPELRINEILNSFGKTIDPLFEMNIPNTWWCDIEVEVSENGFPEPEEASTPINTISLTKFPRTIIWSRKNLSLEDQNWIQNKIDNYSQENNGSDITKGYKFEFRYFPTEREMLEDFLTFITPITAISGWNFLGFDWLYIYNRCKMHNIDIERISPTRTFTTFKITPRSGGKTIHVHIPYHKIIYDYLLVYKTWDMMIYPKENNTLDFVAEKALKIKKVQHAWGFKDGYENHFKEYVFYNCIDTILVEHIDKYLKTSEIWYMIACELRLELNVAFSTIQPTHVVMCNFVYPHYKVIPEQKKKSEESGDYEGAFVWPTRPGIFKYIGGLDFASLYPSIIRQFGISPETFLFKDINYIPNSNEIKTCSGAVYRKDPDALIPAILTHYFALRKAAKNDKKIANSEYEELKHILEKRKQIL